MASQLGTYVIKVEVTETAYPSNGPDSFSSTAEILASYACELEDKINAGYHGRLKVTLNQVGVPANPTEGIR